MYNGRCAHYFDNRRHGDDAWLVREFGPYSVLDAVFDGISTAQGSTASSLTSRKLAEANIATPDDVIRVLEEANDELYERYHGCSSTTATVSVKTGSRLYMINIGDSPAFIVRNGIAGEVTTLDKESAESPAYVTNYVGRREFMYHMTQMDLTGGDRLLVMTDGISDNVYPAEIMDIFHGCRTPLGTIRKLRKLMSHKRSTDAGRDDVYGRFKEDDVTAIVRYFM
ncbi:MAG: SpoIIE family protein phosphatase [Candidatus Aenigmarchaeota archaeon]|nr:SpoIIE family protein phosphatase [Candidatus Aenigmarchaeota archaeon]